MISIDLKSLVKKMSPYLRESLEGAAGICMSQGQFNVELEHWLLKLLDQSDTDIYQLLETHEVNTANLAKQLATAVAQFKSGSSRPAALSPAIVEAAKNAWMVASVDFGHGTITSGHLFAGLLLDDNLKRQILDSCSELSMVAPESVRNAARVAFGETGESKRAAAAGAIDSSSVPTPGGQQAGNSKTPTLDKYTIDLTAKAKSGKMDPILGRDEEIRQCMDILTRRRQNNPIMTGEAGVGKTAVVEGLAQRIAEGDVPDTLKNITLRTLDLGLLQAGASVKGEFENRLKSVIEEVQSSPTPIILFIDEAHTLIGAGGKEGQGDAANLLKPALARGELRTLAATTWAEYKKYFERDPALTRRFQVVKVEEPSEDKAIDMMRGVATALEKHHKVRILEEAIVASVTLSHRYIPGRQLPDKSVSLLDTACARVSLSLSAVPYPIEDAKRRIERSDAALGAIGKEHAVSGGHQEKLDELAANKAIAEADLERLSAQYEQEKMLVSSIKEIYDSIDNNETEAPSEHTQQEISRLSSELKAVQGDNPLIHPHVDAQAVAEIIANWTGIPVGKMVSDEIHAVQTLAERLNKRVIGQSHGLEAVAQAIQTSRAGLTDPRKPMGVFLFCGTSGVGKTETALALADELFGGEQNITTINMSEFKEEHKVSMLLGSPPGYVGFGEGGVLTEAARRKPYSVILLDEMEKAHPGVQDIFYNLFDKGTIKDGEGRDIDFKNTLIIMTSNAGEGAIRAIFDQAEEKPEPDVLLDNIRPHLLQHFKSAFLGRANVVPYYPLDDENLVKICAINMRRIEKRVSAHYSASFSYDEDVLINIVARCQEADTGARNIEGILNKTLLPELASLCLSRMAEDKPITKIHVGATEEGDFTYTID